MANTTDVNYLLPSKATLDIHGGNTFSFHIQQFRIPRVYGFISEQPTPHLNVPIIGNKMVYDALEVSFIITEDMKSYTELYNWMRGNYAPYGAPEYIAEEFHYRDASLMVYTSANNPSYKIKFYDLFPIKIDEIIFDIETQTADPLKSKVEFAFRNFDIEYIGANNTP
jgi:hypothetical protein